MSNDIAGRFYYMMLTWGHCHKVREKSAQKYSMSSEGNTLCVVFKINK